MLHLTGAAILVSHGITVLQAAPAGELLPSATALQPGHLRVSFIFFTTRHYTVMRSVRSLKRPLQVLAASILAFSF